MILVKKDCKMKCGLEGSILKCQSWSLLTKKPINVQFCDILVLLNHLNNKIRNEDVEILQLRAKFQIAMVPCSRIIWITTSSDHRRIWTVNFLHPGTLNLSSLSSLMA